MRLSYDGTDIDFQSGEETKIPYDLKVSILISKNGTLWIAKEYEVGKWEPVVQCGLADADNFNLWTQERYTCTFVPDQDDDPGTTYQVKLLNTERPMQRSFDGGPVYDGQLIIRVTGP